MKLSKELELAEQEFQGSFERGDYEKALAAALNCKRLSENIFQQASDLAGLVPGAARQFMINRTKWKYYRDMENEIKGLIKQRRKKENPGLLRRLFGG